MNKKFYAACGAAAFALVACSDDNGRLVGTSVEPNTMGELSSSSVLDGSSSSVDGCSSSSFDAEDGDLWNPSAGGFSVNVARYAALLPANAKADGRWVQKTDAEKGGTSSVVWPTDLVGVQDERTVVESCDGICGTVSLAKYSLTYDPFAGVGFTLAKDDDGKPVPVDVTDWGGVCITYESEAAPALELDLGDSLNALLGDALPAVALPKTKTTGPVTKCYEWSDFKYPGWFAAVADVPEYWLENPGEKAAKQLVALRFVISDSAGDYKFNIKSLGTYADAQAGQSESSSSAVQAVVNPADLWNGAAGDKTVKTALYADDSWKSLAKGEWYDYTDRYSGGNSSFSWWKYRADDDHSGLYFEQVIDECGGLCGSVKLSGMMDLDPVALFGFQLANKSTGGVKAVDITNWNGVCVTYQTDIPIVLDLNPVSLEVDFDTASADFVVEEDDYEIYKWPSVTLPVTSEESTMCFAWDDFTQAYLDKVPNGEKYKTTVENVLKRVVAIRFVITGKTGDKGDFYLKALGTNRK